MSIICYFLMQFIWIYILKIKILKFLCEIFNKKYVCIFINIGRYKIIYRYFKADTDW